MSIQQNFPALSPTLLLDFANTKQLDPRITFTRASTATFYNGVTTAMAEQNLLPSSQAFESSAWVLDKVTVSTNSTLAPDGTTTAETITENTANGEHSIYQIPGIVAATYTFSVFAKIASGTRNLGFRGFGQGGTGLHPIFDLAGGTVVQAGSNWTGVSITSVGNGWYRCVGTVTATAGTPALFSLFSGTTLSYTGDGTSGLYLWGAQLEQRSSVTAYTPTTTQPITNYIPVLQTAASGVARFEHNPVTGESLGLEIEEQRTNLFTYSDQFDNAAWTKNAASITANTVVSPDGTLIGDSLIENASLGIHQVGAAANVVSGTAYTLTVFAKAISGNRQLAINFASNFGTGWNDVFDLVTGVVLFNQSGGASISSVGNGWYRCVVTRTATATAVTGFNLRLRNPSAGDSLTYTGDGYSGIFIWGAQLEAGAFATSYIPTVASQVTRAADAASMTGTNFSSWYNAAEGTFYNEQTFNGVNPAGVFGAVWSFNNFPNDVSYTYNPGNASGLFVRDSGTTQVNLSNTYTVNVPQKAAAVLRLNDFAQSTNGGTPLTDTLGVVPAPVGSFLIGNSQANGTKGAMTIRKIAYYPLRVSNTNLQALTS